VKLAVLGLWLAALLVFWWFLWRHDLGPLRLLQAGLEVMTGSLAGALSLLGLYLLRPLLLFPATPLIVLAGFAFGPVGGVLYALLAGTLSALVAYLFGRYAVSGSALRGLDRGFVRRLRRHPFETVLTGRLIFLPGDLINYSCGVLGIRLPPFVLATLLGGVPGTLAAGLFGASLEGELGSWPTLNVQTLLLSAGVLMGSLLLSRALQSRRAQPA
jgi:uncharacterized membrane protein YdjX (TVP38/TMEM64 family)